MRRRPLQWGQVKMSMPKLRRRIQLLPADFEALGSLEYGVHQHQEALVRKRSSLAEEHARQRQEHTPVVLFLGMHRTEQSVDGDAGRFGPQAVLHELREGGLP